MEYLLVLLFSALTVTSAIGQVRDRKNMQFDVHIGDTIYKYSFFTQPSRWIGYIVVSKDTNNLITARSLDETELIKPYQRRNVDEYDPLTERVYAGKDELKGMLSIMPKFYLQMTKVKRKRGNSIVDLTKSANLKVCTFSDNYIGANWVWGDNKYFGLEIYNKSPIDPIIIMWNDAVYVDMDGNSCPITNVTNPSSDSHKETTIILEHTKATLAVIPNSCFTSHSSSQITYGVKLSRYKNLNSNFVRISIPIKIKGVISRYDFYFVIDYISELEYLKKMGLIDI